MSICASLCVSREDVVCRLAVAIDASILLTSGREALHLACIEAQDKSEITYSDNGCLSILSG